MSQTSLPTKAVIAQCQERGYLAKLFYMVSTRPVNGLGPVMENIEPHLAFQEKLERDGILFAAGPHLVDDESWEGDGIVVLRASSLAEAHEIAAGDPMHINGARKFTVRPWLVNEGMISVQLDFATGKFKLM